MTEEKNVETKVEKTPTKTDLFKQHLQKIIYQQLGVKVSKSKAWDLFKATQKGTVQFVLKDADNRLPLAGIGTFEVLKTQPRGSKAGLDKDGNPIEGATPWEFVPRFRFYPSSVIKDEVEQFFGLGDHNLEVKDYGIFASDDEPKVEEKKASKPKKEKKPATTANEPDEVVEEEDLVIDDEDIL